jgi:uncharacterized protein YjbI with pentapeptide repeats
MANEEHLALLLQSIDAWNEWRQKNPVIPVLSLVNLSQANLYQANLRRAVINQASLVSANLGQANLKWADLSQTNLSQANLNQANLSQANLQQADLSYANLAEADLKYADLSLVNLQKVDLTQADLGGAVLRGANLQGAKLGKATLQGSDCSGANFQGADLTGANLTGANLTGANLSQAQVAGANFSQATLTGAYVKDWYQDEQTNLNDAILDNPAMLSGLQATSGSEMESVVELSDRPDAHIAALEQNGFPKSEALLLETASLQELLQLDYNHHEQNPNPVSEIGPSTASARPDRPAQSAVELVFEESIDWQVFLLCFEDLQLKYGSTALSIQALEQRDMALIIRLQLVPELDAAELETYAKAQYKQLLNTLDPEDSLSLVSSDQAVQQRQSSVSLLDIIQFQAKPLQELPAIAPMVPAIAPDTLPVLDNSLSESSDLLVPILDDPSPPTDTPPSPTVTMMPSPEVSTSSQPPENQQPDPQETQDSQDSQDQPPPTQPAPETKPTKRNVEPYKPPPIWG